MNRLVDYFVRFFLRWVPDSFVIAIILTLLTFLLAIGITDYSITNTVTAWGDGFWNLLKFTNQITLTLLLGYALANTEPVRKGLGKLANLIPNATAAYICVCLVTGICALVSWGLSLITAGVFARAVGEACKKKGIKVHYPLLVASSFSGFVVWHQGLSGSVTLTIATDGHFLMDQIGLISIDQTIFTQWNLTLAAAVLLTLPLFMAYLQPADNDIEEIPDALMAEAVNKTAEALDKPAEAPNKPAEALDKPAEAPNKTPAEAHYKTPAEALETSPILNWAMVVMGLAYLYIHFIVRGDGLTLNIFNFSFLVMGILMAGSPAKFIQIIIDGGRVAAVFLIQYPLYSGIAAVMASSGLASLLVEFFINIADAETLPYFSFLSGGLLNLFIPSGGGQWAVQGPIMMAAAQNLGADLPRIALSVALGDQWTNLIQPLTIVPVLAIAQVPLRSILGYCFFGFLFSGVLFSIWLILF